MHKPRLSSPGFLAACLLSCLSNAYAQTAPSGPTVLDTVQVSATPDSAQDTRQFASQATIVIGREELERLDAATVAELLRQLPGVNLSPPGTGRGGRARGEDRLQPNIVVDGIALPGGNRAAFNLPADLIERIEIIKVSTPEFPAGPGGTVNLVLRDTPGTKAGTWRAGLNHNTGGPGARAGLTYGDREGEVGLILMGFGDTRALAGGRKVSTETFTGGVRTAFDIEQDADSGRSDGLHLIARRTQNLGGGARLIISPMLFGRQNDLTNTTQKWTYLDPANANGLIADGRARDASLSRNLNGRLTFDYRLKRPGQGETSAMLAMQGEYDRSVRTRQDYDAASVLQTDVRTEDARNGYNLRFRGKTSRAFTSGTHLVTGGLDMFHRDVTDRRQQSSSGVPQALGAQARADARESELAVWAQDEWQLAEAHTLTPGLRISASSRAVTDGVGVRIADDSVAWLPSISYLWRVTESWNLRASAASSERLPNVRDLSPVVRTTTGQNTLANPDRAGNPALRPESTTTLQIGVERFLPAQRGSAGLNVFFRDISDKVQRRTQIEGGRFVERPFNIDSATETSVVADFKWKVAELPGLSLRGNVSTNRLKLDDNGGFVRQESPRRAASLGVDYEWQPHRITLGSNLSYSGRFSREANPDTAQTTRPRTQLDLFVAKKFSNRLSLRFSVDNVTETGSGDDTQEYASGVLVQQESDRARGVRVVNLSLEGRF